MFAVVFEVHPAAGRKAEYLALAKRLKPNLEAIDGFIDNERFESRRREGWVLSLSTWRDEKAVVRWRSHGEHHKVQEQGRSGIFSDYHLRVCEVTADTHPPRDLQVIEQRLRCYSDWQCEGAGNYRGLADARGTLRGVPAAADPSSPIGGAGRRPGRI